jgi:uncharacterized protein
MGGISDILTDYVESTIKKIVDKPEDVKVDTNVSTKAIIVYIQTSQEDVGKIIGKHGRTVDALKVLCLAIKNTHFPEDPKRVLIEVLEDENSNFSYKQK